MVIELPVAADDLPRVRAILAGKLEPVVPRPAVSVVLVRDGDDGLEVHLLRRNPRLAFAPGRYVFPGGSVEASDADDSPWHGSPPAEPALVAAGVRETFEECGVLLAVDASGRPAVVERDADGERDRMALEAGTTSLAAVLRARGLALGSGMLVPLAHWVTPIAEKRRYDTRFLLAALPSGCATWDVVGEADLQVWLRPADALAQRLPLMLPTLAILRELSGESSVAEALARPRDIPRIQPGLRLVGDHLELLLP